MEVKIDSLQIDTYSLPADKDSTSIEIKYEFRCRTYNSEQKSVFFFSYSVHVVETDKDLINAVVSQLLTERIEKNRIEQPFDAFYRNAKDVIKAALDLCGLPALPFPPSDVKKLNFETVD